MRQIVLIVLGLFLLGCSGQSENERASQDAPAPQDERPLPTNAPQNLTDTSKAQQSPALTPNSTEGSFHLVMLGDSITAGFGLAAPEALPVQLETALRGQGQAITIVNAGVSGDTTGDARNRFNWSVDEKADGIFIALGGNDLLQGVNPEITRDNLVHIITAAKARNLTVLLAGMIAPGNYGVQYQTEFDRIFPELANDYSIAFYPFLLEGVATDPTLNQADGIHPNEKGVDILVENLTPFIIKALDQ